MFEILQSHSVAMWLCSAGRGLNVSLLRLGLERILTSPTTFTLIRRKITSHFFHLDLAQGWMVFSLILTCIFELKTKLIH